MPEELVRCNTCLKSFKTRGRYNQHLKTHSRPFRCDPCQRGFALRSDVDRHVKAWHRLGHNVFHCPHGCRFETKRKDNLSRHLKNKHEIAIQARRNESQEESTEKEARLSKPSPATPIDSDNSAQLFPYLLLMQAATAGNLAILNASLEAGIDIQFKAADGSTALHCAARADQTVAVHYLLDQGAEIHCVNDRFRTPLAEAILGRSVKTLRVLLRRAAILTSARLTHYVAQSGSLEVFRLFIEYLGEKFTTEAQRRLARAATKFGQTAMVVELLARPGFAINGMNYMGDTLLHQAVRYGKIEIANLLLASGQLDPNTPGMNGLRPIHIAAMKGHAGMMKFLLSQKRIHAPSIMTGQNALHIAASNGHSDVVQILIDHESMDPFCADSNDELPLHKAAANGHWDIVDLLLRHTYQPKFSENHENKDTLEIVERLLSIPTFQDVNSIKYKGETLLHCSIKNKDTRLTKFLLARKDIDVNLWNTNLIPKQNPLHVAALCGNAEGAALLLQHKDIDINARDTHGVTALKLVKRYNNQGVVDLLLSHGAMDETNNIQSILHDKSTTHTHHSTDLGSRMNNRHGTQNQSSFDELMEDFEMDLTYETEHDSEADLMDDNTMEFLAEDAFPS